MEAKQEQLSRRIVLALGGEAALALSSPQSIASAANRPTAALFSTDAGRGRNIMLLHGWTCDSHDWSWQLPFLKGRYRVVAADLRGHGRSEVPPSGSYMPADYVSDIEALISVKSAGQPFVLVGHSLGGQIAARLAAKRPDLVSAVVSIEGALGALELATDFFAKTTRDLQGEYPHDVACALFQLNYDPATEPAFKEWHARRVQGMPRQVIAESFGPLFLGPGQLGAGEQSAEFCASLTTPVYHLCRDSEQATRMRPWFKHPKSKVDVWPRAGHWIMQDRPADVNAAVSAWIETI